VVSSRQSPKAIIGAVSVTCIVGAHLQPDNAIRLLAAGGQHEHRNRAELARAQFAAQHEAIFARQHQVQHDEVGGALLQHGAHLATVRGERDAHAVLLQIACDQLANTAVVVDDQHMVDVVHQAIIPSGD
jgi:hypothetical protein